MHIYVIIFVSLECTVQLFHNWQMKSFLCYAYVLILHILYSNVHEDKKTFFMRQKTCEMVPWNELSQVPSVLLPPTNNCICNEHLGLKAAILHKKINLVFFFLSRLNGSTYSFLFLSKRTLVYESHTHCSVFCMSDICFETGTYI